MKKMAGNARILHFLRGFSHAKHAVSPCPRPLGFPADVKSTLLPSKVVVAGVLQSTMPVTRLSVIFRAGARNEDYETRGAAHMLRLATGLGTKKASGFAIMRNIQQIGGSLTCAVDRETVAYTLVTTSDKVETAMCYLSNVIQPSFKPWEVNGSLETLKYQVEHIPPQVLAVELLHHAAYRNGLGNSLYIPKHQIGQLSGEAMMDYIAENFTTNRCAVIGVGIDPNRLTGFAQCLDVEVGDSKPARAIYYGGDARKDTPGYISHVAVAGQSVGLQNQKEALVFAILQQALGPGAATKRGKIPGNFGNALADAVGDAPVSFKLLNFTYADTGLFGFLISADEQDICKAVHAAAKALKSATISPEDFERGKNLLKASMLETYANDGLVLTELGRQASLTRQVLSIEKIVAAIDSIPETLAQDVVKNFGASKLSVGAVGNLGNVPYASDLVYNVN